MGASRAYSAGFECIPFGSASVVEVLRMIAVPTRPPARSQRPPFADRASNTGQSVVDLVLFGYLGQLHISFRAPEFEDELGGCGKN